MTNRYSKINELEIAKGFLYKNAEGFLPIHLAELLKTYRATIISECWLKVLDHLDNLNNVQDVYEGSFGQLSRVFDRMAQGEDFIEDRGDD